MKKTIPTIFEVELTYRIEAPDATTALDKCLGAHPLKPSCFACNPVDIEDEDD